MSHRSRRRPGGSGPCAGDGLGATAETRPTTMLTSHRAAAAAAAHLRDLSIERAVAVAATMGHDCSQRHRCLPQTSSPVGPVGELPTIAQPGVGGGGGGTFEATEESLRRRVQVLARSRSTRTGRPATRRTECGAALPTRGFWLSSPAMDCTGLCIHAGAGGEPGSGRSLKGQTVVARTV